MASIESGMDSPDRVVQAPAPCEKTARSGAPQAYFFLLRSGPPARWPILNFAFFAKFRVGMLEADAKPATGCEEGVRIESE